MANERRNTLLLACAVLAFPVAAFAQSSVTDQQALCTVAPETPSCSGGATAPSTDEDQSTAVGGTQKVMRLVAMPTTTRATASTATATATRPAYTPSAGTSTGRMTLVKPPRYNAAPVRPRAVANAMPARASDMVLTFPTGSADLTDAAKANIKVYARALLLPQVAERRYAVEGHTDAVGSRTANLELSRRRAESVVSALIAEGVPAARLEARGYGASHLRFPGRPGDSGNRRVELNRSR